MDPRTVDDMPISDVVYWALAAQKEAKKARDQQIAQEQIAAARAR